MQSKRQSMIEAVINVLSGYFPAVLLQIIVFPWFDIKINLAQNFLMGLLFTIPSILRSYYIRRLFNWWHHIRP
jgi:hypothetical protein